MKKTIFFAVVFVLILGLATNPVSAKEIITWEHISEGMDGGIIQAIAIDSSNLSILYAGTPVGVYKSIDGGENWLEINEGLSGFDVISIEINPFAPNIIYIVSSGVVYKSENGGQQWLAISQGLDPLELHCIAVNPIDPSILLVGAKQGFYRSVDAGKTWSFIPISDAEPLFFSSIAFDPINPKNVYGGSTKGHFYKSTDCGDNWVMKLEDDYRSRIKHITIDKQNPNNLYFITHEKAYRSTNGGETYGVIKFEIGMQSLAIHPNDPLTIYLGAVSSIFKTTDGGNNWYSLDDWFFNIKDAPNVILINPNNPEIIYAGTRGAGLQKSINNGENWMDSHKGISANNITGITQSTQFPNVFYVSASLGGVFKSVDFGESWVSLRGSLEKSNLTGIGVNPNNPDIVFVGDGFGRMNKSEDGGSTWREVFNISLIGGKFTFKFDPIDPEIIYAGTHREVLKSVDGGDTWVWLLERHFASFVCDLVIDPSNTNIIYVATEEYVRETKDSGETWSIIKGANRNVIFTSIALDESNTNILFIGGTDGVYKSVGSNYGWNTHEFNTGLPTLNITTLYTDSERGLVYAGTSDGGIYVSEIETANWSPVNIGLKSKRVNLLVGDKSVASTIYAGTKGGVFRSSKTDLNHQLYLPLTIK